MAARTNAVVATCWFCVAVAAVGAAGLAHASWIHEEPAVDAADDGAMGVSADDAGDVEASGHVRQAVGAELERRVGRRGVHDGDGVAGHGGEDAWGEDGQGRGSSCGEGGHGGGSWCAAGHGEGVDSCGSPG